MMRWYSLRIGLPVVVLLALGFLSVNFLLQNREVSGAENKSCEPLTLPPSMLVGDEALNSMISVMSLPQGKRQAAFSELNNQQKSDVFRLRLAFELAVNSNFSDAQRAVFVHAIGNNTPSTYDAGTRAVKQLRDEKDLVLRDKALAVFPEKEAYLIFATLSFSAKAMEMAQGYRDLLTLPSGGPRTAYLRKVRSEEKSRLWRGQTAYYLATSNFQEIQRGFFVEVLHRQTPNAFGSDAPAIEGKEDIDAPAIEGKEFEALMALEEIAYASLSPAEVRAYFMVLGAHKQVTAPPVEPGPEGIIIENPYCDCKWTCGNLCWACSNVECMGPTSGCGWNGNQLCESKCILMQNCP